MSDTVDPAAIIDRVKWRCIPLLLVSYIVCYIDRVNVGFAALTANRDLGLSATQYGWGAGILFLGYFVFEVPSNLMLEKIGARRWLARIMVTWGVIGFCMIFVAGPYSFYAMRFLLGAAEAGLFPGVILYLTYWFPRRHRARFMAWFVLGIPLSSLIGSPISGLLLGLDGWLGVRGWQWLYIIESLPAIVLGVVTWFWLTDLPARATWLTPAQRAWLQSEVDRDRSEPQARQPPLWHLLGDLRVWVYSAVFFGTSVPSYGLGLWLPQIVKAFGLSNAETGFVAAIPSIFGCLGMVLWGRHSDRQNERTWHTIMAALVAAVGLILCVATGSPTLQITAVSFAMLGIYGIKGPMWAMITEAFDVRSAAAAIALVSSIGNLSGWAAPYMVALVKTATGSFALGLMSLGVMSGLGGGTLLVYVYHGRLRGRRDRSLPKMPDVIH
jgi:D-galactonate transporter